MLLPTAAEPDIHSIVIVGAPGAGSGAQPNAEPLPVDTTPVDVAPVDRLPGEIAAMWVETWHSHG
jgi:hypothetical protein